jgi:valyl-tRNA synthetase
MAAQGRDIKLSEQRVAGYRNFVTKLWNAARLCEMNECRAPADFDPSSCTGVVNRWIIGEMAEAARRAAAANEAYRFNEAAEVLYRFVWHTFCDWYLEIVKPVLYGDEAAAKAEARVAAGWVLDRTLEALHPLMPFVTEELFAKLGDRRGALLVTARWPEFEGLAVDEAARTEMDWVVRLVGEIRSLRAEMNVPAAATVPLTLAEASAVSSARFARHRPVIEALARVRARAGGEAAPKGAIQLVFDEASLFLEIAGLVDVDEERARLRRELAKAEAEIDRLDTKLSDERFLARAPEAVVAEQRERRIEADLSRRKLDRAVARLSAL